MPLIKIDAVEGRSPSEVTALLEAIHRAVVKAFHVPVRDRYQIYQAHPKGFLVIQDTGLNISRTDQALIITVISKKRDEILKRRFYKELTEQLASSASIAPSDVMVAIIENSAADWSFGNGEPQVLTGELAEEAVRRRRSFTFASRIKPKHRRTNHGKPSCNSDQRKSASNAPNTNRPQPRRGRRDHHGAASIAG